MPNPFIPWRGSFYLHPLERLLLPLYAIVFSFRCLLGYLAMHRAGYPVWAMAVEGGPQMIIAMDRARWLHGDFAAVMARIHSTAIPTTGL